MSCKIALVTDSTSDLPQHLAAEQRIHIVPQRIVWDGQVYHDGLDLTTAAFYQRLAHSPTLPHTEPATPEEFAQAYETARAQNGAEQVVALLLSSRLSRSFVQAQAGARLVDFPVYVYDSMTVSMPLGFAALAAARACQQGASVEEMLEVARQTRRRACVFFTVDTLDFLYRGGRIGGARHLVGTALSLKPILTVREGQVEAAGTVRSRARALQRMLDLAAQEVPPGGDVRLAVLHGDADEEALSLLAPLRKRWSPYQVIESSVCAALGIHTGPGVLAISVCRC